MLQNYLHDVFIIFVTADVRAILVREFFLVLSYIVQNHLFIFRPRRSTSYLDAAYC